MHNEYLHGGVTNVDAEKTLFAGGFEPVLFPYQQDFSIKAKLGRMSFLLKKVMAIKKGAVVVFLSPFYARMDKLFIQLLRMKGITLVCYIVDIDGIKDGNDDLLKEEIAFFRKLKYFIVLNDSMKNWLAETVPGTISAPVYFHTFFTRPVIQQRQRSFEVVFAGNLAKSPFLEYLHLLKQTSPDVHFNVYGPDPTPSMINQENVTYCGVQKPYDLPNKLSGSFGLIWEGNSIEKPEGSIGHYIQYITHHKLSLYIVSGLPVIIAATAGTAPLVEKYKIGVTVKSLFEIEEKIRSISDEDFYQMQINMQPIAEKISNGSYLTNAINEIMEQL